MISPVIAPISTLKLKLETAQRARSAEYLARVSAELAQRWEMQEAEQAKQAPVASVAKVE